MQERKKEGKEEVVDVKFLEKNEVKKKKVIREVGRSQKSLFSLQVKAPLGKLRSQRSTWCVAFVVV
jgi:hypothetical protein